MSHVLDIQALHSIQCVVVALAATCMNIGWNEESADDCEGRPYKKFFVYPPRSCLRDNLSLPDGLD